MPLTDQDIADLLTTTLRDYSKGELTQIAQTYQDYEIMGHLFTEEKRLFSGGTGRQRNVMLDHSGASEMIGMHHEDTATFGDILGSKFTPFKRQSTKFIFEKMEVIENESQPEQINNLVKIRKADAMLSFAETAETQGWTKPTDSNDTLRVFGIPYWIVKNSTQGFNGGAPSGFTAGAGGLSHARWQNWTDTYSAISDADLVEKMELASMKTNFKSPLRAGEDVGSAPRARRTQFRIYTNIDVLLGLRRLCRAQNENLGTDLAGIGNGSITMSGGEPTFRRNPIIWVPYLDADTEDPIYMVNYGWFYMIARKGDFMRTTEVTTVPNHHNSMWGFMDTSWNIDCDNRRAQAVIYNPA